MSQCLLNPRMRTAWLKRHGEFFIFMTGSPVPFKGHLHHDTGILTVSIDQVIPAGTIISRQSDGNKYLTYAQLNVNGLHHESPTKLCSHVATVSRSDATSRDAFGRPAADPVPISADTPLVLVHREVLPVSDKAQSGIRWHLTFETSTSYDLKKGDTLTTATVSATILSVAELTDGILSINAISD
jgi:hypothetical protein